MVSIVTVRYGLNFILNAGILADRPSRARIAQKTNDGRGTMLKLLEKLLFRR